MQRKQPATFQRSRNRFFMLQKLLGQKSVLRHHESNTNEHVFDDKFTNILLHENPVRGYKTFNVVSMNDSSYICTPSRRPKNTSIPGFYHHSEAVAKPGIHPPPRRRNGTNDGDYRRTAETGPARCFQTMAARRSETRQECHLPGASRGWQCRSLRASPG